MRISVHIFGKVFGGLWFCWEKEIETNRKTIGPNAVDQNAKFSRKQLLQKKCWKK